MVNQRKIITMTQLALYDKHEGPADRAANDYFRHDYIYRNNLGTRLAVGCGSIIILLIYWLQNILINEMDLFELNFRQIGMDSLFFLLAVLAFYSLIGTIQGTRQYYLVQKHLAQYQALVRQLERLEERAQRVYDDEGEPNPAARTAPPRDGAAMRTRRTVPPPGPGHTAPLVRTGGPVGPARPMPPGATVPPRPLPPGATRPPRPMPPVTTGPPRPMPPDATRPPRPMPPGTAGPGMSEATRAPGPVPPGHIRPHPPPAQDKPPPRPLPPATPPGATPE